MISRILIAVIFLAGASLASQAVEFSPVTRETGKYSLSKSDWAVSTDGLSYLLTESNDGSARVYRVRGGTRELGPAAPGAAKPAPPGFRSLMSTDGKYVFTLAKSTLVIRDPDSAAVIWNGDLGSKFHRFPDAAHYDERSKRFQLLVDSRLRTFVLEPGGRNTLESDNEVKFPSSSIDPEARYISFVESGAFSRDGKTLYVGNVDGEVLRLALDQAVPTVVARIRVFPEVRTLLELGLDDRDGQVSELACVQDCQFLIARSYRSTKAAIIQTSTNAVLGSHASSRICNLVGIGANKFVLKSWNPRTLRYHVELMDATLHRIRELPSLSEISGLIFGYQGGFAAHTPTSGGPVGAVTFIDVANIVDGERRQLKQREEYRRLQEKGMEQFRQNLKTGSDTHCGLAIERKGNIVLVETPIGQKWLKIAQLYSPGERDCVFVNGVYRDAP